MRFQYKITKPAGGTRGPRCVRLNPDGPLLPATNAGSAVRRLLRESPRSTERASDAAPRQSKRIVRAANNVERYSTIHWARGRPNDAFDRTRQTRQVNEEGRTVNLGAERPRHLPIDEYVLTDLDRQQRHDDVHGSVHNHTLLFDADVPGI